MKFTIKEGIFIAILPLFGYLAAYNYEIGYLGSFNLPSSLAQVSIESLVSFTVLTTLFIFVLIGAVDLLYPYYKNPSKNPLLHGIIKAIYIPLFGLFFIFYFDTQKQMKFLPVYIGLFIFSIIVYFLALYTRDKGKNLSLTDKIKLLNEPKQKQKDNSILDVIPFKSEISLFLLSIFVIAWVGQAIGDKAGADVKKFITFKYRNNRYALIRNYNGEKLAIKLNGNDLTTEYMLFKTESLEFQINEINR